MDYGAVQSKLSFSFGDYYDPKHMGFRALRVINQDVVAAGAGFPTHGHKDMEIFSYVLEGTIAHRDSLGNNAELKPGQIQVMSAGSGVKHSEFNPSKSEVLRFIQVWIEPKAKGLSPRYSEWKPTHEMQSAAKGFNYFGRWTRAIGQSLSGRFRVSIEVECERKNRSRTEAGQRALVASDFRCREGWTRFISSGRWMEY